MEYRLAPDNIPPPPPSPPVRGYPAMDQLPHDFASRTHIIEPPQHRNSIPTPGYGDDRPNLSDSGSEPAVLEGWTIARQTVARQPTYAVAKRTRWIAREDELKELVKKQQKRGTRPYVPVNGTTDIKSNKRAQVERLVQDRNNDTSNDSGTQYELAALKLEQFQIKGGADERLKVVLRRRVRRGVPHDPSRPITASTRFSSSEIIDLGQSDDHDRSSQSSSYSSPPMHVPGQDPFHLPVHPPPVHHDGHPNPQIFDHRFSQQPFDSPIGEEQPRPAQRDRVVPNQQPDGFRGLGGMGNHPPHPERVVPDQQPDHSKGFGGMGNRPNHPEPVVHDPQRDHSGGFGGQGHHGNDNSENKRGKGDKSKGKQKQQYEESDSSSASDNDIWTVNSDGTPLSAISSSSSSYRGEKRSLRGSPQRQFSTHGRDDRDRGPREEKGYKKESHRFTSGGHDDRNRGRGSEDKKYRHDGHKGGSSGHDHGNHGGGSRSDKNYHPDSHHRRSVSVDRENRGRDDKKERKHHHESRRNSPSRERSEHTYKVEKIYRPERHSSKSDRHRHEYRQAATREHVRKLPDVRSRGSLTDGSTYYTDEEYIMVPHKSSRGVQAAPRNLYPEMPLRPRHALYDDEESVDYVPRPLARSNTASYRPKLANKPFRPVDLHDSRLDYAREQGELQRQRGLNLQREEAELQRQRAFNLQREEEDRIVAQQVQEIRIATKVQEELHKAGLGRNRPFDVSEIPLRAPRGPNAYGY